MADMSYDTMIEVAEAKVDGGTVSAGRALDAMSRAYSKANTPVPTTDSAAAKAQIESLSHDKAWREAFLRGSAAERQQFAALTARAAAGDPTSEALAGDIPPAGVIETTGSALGGRIPTRTLVGEINALRSAGISDGAIQQLLDGYAMSAHEVEAVSRLKAMRLSDREFVARYLAGSWAEVREMRLIAAVLSAPRRAA
jgi:hypothetical protein